MFRQNDSFLTLLTFPDLAGIAVLLRQLRHRPGLGLPSADLVVRGVPHHRPEEDRRPPGRVLPLRQAQGIRKSKSRQRKDFKNVLLFLVLIIM